MPRIYAKTFTVPGGAIDAHGHVNNQDYLRWMQEVAVEQSAAQRWHMERYFRADGSWYIRSHCIEYLQWGVAGDSLPIGTTSRE